MNKLLGFIFAGVLTCGLIGCGKDDHAGEAGAKDEHGHEEGAKTDEHAGEEVGHTEDITLTPEAAKLAGIQTADARMMQMQGQLKVTGVVATTAKGRAVVTPPVDGRITRLLVSVGDNVRTGQPIAVLQSSDLAQALSLINEAQRGVTAAQGGSREAKSQLDLANAHRRTARTVLARQQQLARAGAFAQAPLQQAQRELNEAEAILESAQNEEVVHQAQLERAERLFKQDLISRTELEQARLELQQDKIKQQTATRQIELARQSLQREKTIAERGLLNAREVQAAEADVRAANLEVQQSKIRFQSAASAVSSAQKGVQNARSNYNAISGGGRASGSSVTVVAPIGGTIVDLEVSLGQAVERTSEICEIENQRSVWITANVPERDIAMAHRGSRANVTTTAYPNRLFVGIVQVIGSRIDPKTRSMPVHVLVDNSSGALRTGIFAQVALGVGADSLVLAVPRSAVIADGDRQVVYVAEGGGVYEEKVVTTGRVQGDSIEVTGGLEAGARVVTKGGFTLKSQKAKAELKGHEH